MDTDELTDWERHQAKSGRRVFAWVGGLALLVGIMLAMLLPAAKGTCGLPPFGTDEFCRGNDRTVNAIAFFSGAGLGAALFSLASASRRAIIVGVVVVLAAGFAAAAVVHHSYTCPTGLRLNYYQNGVGPRSPVCTTLLRSGEEPAVVDGRRAVRVVFVGVAVFISAGMVLMAARARSKTAAG